MRLAKIFLPLLFIAVCGATNTVREWKSYENGKVESHKKRVFRLTKNHSSNNDVRREHILHAHHNERTSRHHERTTEQNETPKDPNKWDAYRKNKERHHKTEKKLHLKNPGESIRTSAKPLVKEKELPKGLVNVEEDRNEDTSLLDSKRKRAKPEGGKAIVWRRAQREAENARIEELKSYNAKIGQDKRDYPTGKRQKFKLQSKKMVISRMDGNQKAKQVWKESFRGEDRISKD